MADRGSTTQDERSTADSSVHPADLSKDSMEHEAQGAQANGLDGHKQSGQADAQTQALLQQLQTQAQLLAAVQQSSTTGASISASAATPITLSQPIQIASKGKIDEISRHLSSFHGYKSPQYSMETWYHLSVDLCPAVIPYKREDTPIADGQPPEQTSCSPVPYCRGPAPYCEGATPPLNTDHAPYCEGATRPSNPDPTPYCEGAPPSSNNGPAPYCEGTPPPSNPGSAHPELMCVPGMDYSMILNPAPAPPQDFYTCVKGVTPGGALHLVPCLPDALKNTPYLQFTDDCADKSSQRAALLEKQMEVLLSSSDSDPCEAALPLIPHSSDTN